MTAQAGVAAGGWSVSAGFFDFDNDGLLDLLVTRYLDWDLAHSKICARQTYCPPIQFPPVTNILYRNCGHGKFQDVSERSGIARKKGRALGVAFNDYDGDGYTDVFVANDGMEEFLFHNTGHGTFEERALETGVALSDEGKPYAGMGVDFRDYDNDGRPDLMVTDLARQVYALYHNDGNGLFTYRSRETGMAAVSSLSSGWGMRWEDFDNDGWKDLLIAQGHVMDNVEEVDPGLHYREPILFAFHRGGRFERAELRGHTEAMAGRGAAFGDLDNDGFMDAVVGVLGGRPVVIRDPGRDAGNHHHWLTLALEGTGSNRDGLGATVHIGDQWQYATTAGSYASASDKRVHFGLASARAADIEIRWPSGERQALKAQTVDRVLHVKEPSRP